MSPDPVTLFSWPRTHEPALDQALLRVTPEDFIVEELMPYTLTGNGEHLWVKLRKRGHNSEQVAKQLARHAGVTRREIGYAGMKDRHAIGVQWFSVLLTGRPDPDWSALPEGMTVLESMRHTRKLKTGALAGNRFTIVLRECSGNRDLLTQRMVVLQALGVPNYFGEQRFGQSGGNVAAARAMFAGGIVRDRKQSGIYLSAARSQLFNAVLGRRVAEANWNQAQPGDAMILNGSRSFFALENVDDTIQQRLAEGDIHASGPLWGRGDLPTKLHVREIETAVATEYADLARGLEAAGLEQERRALRVIPQDLEASWEDATTLRLSFGLPPGCYATMVLRELAAYRDTALLVTEGAA